MGSGTSQGWEKVGQIAERVLRWLAAQRGFRLIAAIRNVVLQIQSVAGIKAVVRLTRRFAAVMESVARQANLMRVQVCGNVSRR
ncbi:MAG: hypothetical protein AB9917_00890 [Negativicutes bacterium]